MSTLLGVSASQGGFACALVRDGGPPQRAGGPGHRTDLHALLHTLLGDHGSHLAEVTGLRLDVGPGSYTGLRTALTFANVLVTCHGSTAMSVCTSLELHALAHGGHGILRPVLDARRGRLHHAPVHCTADTVRLAGEPRATPPDGLAAVLQPGERVLAPAPLHGSLAAMCTGAGAGLEELPAFDGTHLFDPRLQPRPARAPVEPLYLMGSYAGE